MTVKYTLTEKHDRPGPQKELSITEKYDTTGDVIGYVISIKEDSNVSSINIDEADMYTLCKKMFREAIL